MARLPGSILRSYAWWLRWRNLSALLRQKIKQVCCTCACARYLMISQCPSASMHAGLLFLLAFISIIVCAYFLALVLISQLLQAVLMSVPQPRAFTGSRWAVCALVCIGEWEEPDDRDLHSAGAVCRITAAGFLTPWYFNGSGESGIMSSWAFFGRILMMSHFFTGVLDSGGHFKQRDPLRI